MIVEATRKYPSWGLRRQSAICADGERPPAPWRDPQAPLPVPAPPPARRTTEGRPYPGGRRSGPREAEILRLQVRTRRAPDRPDRPARFCRPVRTINRLLSAANQAERWASAVSLVGRSVVSRRVSYVATQAKGRWLWACRHFVSRKEMLEAVETICATPTSRRSSAPCAGRWNTATASKCSRPSWSMGRSS